MRLTLPREVSGTNLAFMLLLPLPQYSTSTTSATATATASSSISVWQLGQASMTLSAVSRSLTGRGSWPRRLGRVHAAHDVSAFPDGHLDTGQVALEQVALAQGAAAAGPGPTP